MNNVLLYHKITVEVSDEVSDRRESLVIDLMNRPINWSQFNDNRHTRNPRGS